MISGPLLSIILLVLILVLVYWGLSYLISGTPLKIVGVLFAVIIVLFTLQRLGVLGSIDL